MKDEARNRLLWLLPPKIAHSLIFHKSHGKWLNVKNPATYDERIHALSVTTYKASYGKYADKLAVREYVKKCGYEDMLIPVYGVYDNPANIDYDALPEKFILMANHGSGDLFYKIVKAKSELDRDAVCRQFDKALKTNYAKQWCQYQYRDIKPCIMAMEYLEDGENDRLDDYKVICSDGKPISILVCTDRDKGKDYYSPEWEYQEYSKEKVRSGKVMEKPALLDKMLKAAESLSAPFPLSRIDFYIVNGKLYFGEVTLTPAAGIHHNLTKEGQTALKG